MILLFFLSPLFLSFSVPQGRGSAAETRRALLFFIFSGIPQVHISAFHRHPKYKTIFLRNKSQWGSPFQKGNSPFPPWSDNHFSYFYGSFFNYYFLNGGGGFVNQPRTSPCLRHYAAVEYDGGQRLVSSRDSFLGANDIVKMDAKFVGVICRDVS